MSRTMDGGQDDVMWVPLVSFTDDPTPSFVNGFEAGGIWGAMQSGEPTITTTIHDENRGVVIDMANAAGYEVDISSSEVPGWSDLVARRLPRRGPLSVVK